MLISLTVGKVDAGVAVLLTQDKRLIEFPSILLPPNISSGSIVDITVARNFDSERASQNAFLRLQDSILQSFGVAEPTAPVLRCRNATQTSIVLEWDPIDVATAEVISLSLFRNGQKAGNIPQPTVTKSTKISGLAVDTLYTFQLLLRTTAGTFASEKLEVKTHKMTDLSGITVTPGILPAQLRESLMNAVERIGGKVTDAVRIDTTHFVTTEGRGVQWEKAVEMNIPVVRPEWVEGCERGGRIVGVRQYYLDADPRQRMAALSDVRPAQQTTSSDPRKQSVASNASTTATKEQAPLPALPTGESASPPPATDGKEERDDAGEKISEEDDKDEKKDDDDDDDEPRTPEQKAEHVDGQKVRVKDREDQKVALRPRDSTSAENRDDTISPKTAAPQDSSFGREEAEEVKTPGDASFQDVAL